MTHHTMSECSMYGVNSARVMKLVIVMIVNFIIVLNANNHVLKTTCNIVVIC